MYYRYAPTELIRRRDRPEELGNIFACSVVISRSRNDNIYIRCKGQIWSSPARHEGVWVELSWSLAPFILNHDTRWS